MQARRLGTLLVALVLMTLSVTQLAGAQEPQPVALEKGNAVTAPCRTVLPTGTWSVNVNSYKGSLTISSVDAAGNVTGTLLGHELQGVWHEASQTLTFMRIMDNARPTTHQIYTGYMFGNGNGNGDGSSCIYTLAGSALAFPASGGTAARSLYGWVAEKTLFYVE